MYITLFTFFALAETNAVTMVLVVARLTLILTGLGKKDLPTARFENIPSFLVADCS